MRNFHFLWHHHDIKGKTVYKINKLPWQVQYACEQLRSIRCIVAVADCTIRAGQAAEYKLFRRQRHIDRRYTLNSLLSYLFCDEAVVELFLREEKKTIFSLRLCLQIVLRRCAKWRIRIDVHVTKEELKSETEKKQNIKTHKNGRNARFSQHKCQVSVDCMKFTRHMDAEMLSNKLICVEHGILYEIIFIDVFINFVSAKCRNKSLHFAPNAENVLPE